jgi:peptide/nickel transport system substrate-binding protein
MTGLQEVGGTSVTASLHAGSGRAIAVLAVVGGLALAIGAGCATQGAPGGAPAGSTAASGAAQGRTVDPNATVRFATTQIHSSMDPFTTSSPTTGRHFEALFDTVAWGVEGTPQPRLATGWTLISPTEWEFALRPNVTFHNGDPMTAEDVKFSYERLMNDGTLAASRRAADIAEVRVVDPVTVRLVTRTPRPTLIENIRQIQILPKNYFTQVGAQRFAEAPVGTGPFALSSWTAGSEFVGERNANYWAGTPQAKMLRISALPDPSTKSAAQRSDGVDAVEFVPVEIADALLKDGFLVDERLSGQMNGIFFDTVQVSPIQNRAVRQALNYGTNKQELLNTFLSGRGQVVGQFGMPGIAGWNPEIQPFPYDVARARQLLAEGGQPNGFTIKMHASVGGTSINSKEVAQALQQSWMRDMRVNVELDLIESALMSQMFTQGGYHPLRLTAQGFGTQVEAILQFYNSSNSYFRAFPNAKRYDNPEFNAIYNRADLEFDMAQRDRLLQQAMRVLHDDAAMVYTALEPTLRTHSPRIDKLRLTVAGNFDWANWAIYRN